MRRIFLLFVLFTFFVTYSFAQRTVTGKVTNDDGDDLPGVTIIAKGTDAATISDLSGSYTLVVPDGVTTLIFQYIGYEDQEKPVADVVNVIMRSDTEIEEVIVNAIGIAKSEKTVSYAVTSVDGDEITKNSDRSALNALQGKVAGVNISSSSGAPGSSTRVIFRGISTFNGSNQPLFVVDGVPINNAESGSTSLNGGTDFGNGINDIDPNIIETVNFFKGSKATVLYGSRAANGVVVITTKSGKGKKGTNISVNSSVKFSTPLRIPQMQNVYGQGIFGNWDLFENTSYGPKFDGEMRYWGHVVDGERLIKPYEGLPNNVSDFFEIGKTYNNSVTLSGGNENTTYFLSLSNITDDGIFPEDRDTYKRNAVTFNGSTKLTDKISSEASLNYVNKKNKFVPTGQGGQSVWNNILQQPRDMPILELANYKDKFFDYDTYYGNYTTNPYWPLLENGNTNNEDRVFGRVELNYNPIEFISIKARVGTDVSNRQLKEWRAVKINSPESEGGFNEGTDREEGRVELYSNWRTQINSDLIVTYNNKFGQFSIDLLAGHNINQVSYSYQYISATGINIEGFYDLSNTYGTPDINEYSYTKRLFGVYGDAQITYKSWLTLSLSDRNDWSSTLPVENNSFNYPSAGLSFVYSDVFPAIKKYIPFGKLRVNWGQVGNDADVHQVYSIYYQPGRFPTPNNINGFSVGNRVANPDLQPEITSETEVGTDMRFLNNRIKLDFAYYKKIITDLIFNVELAASSGYTYQTMNLGKITNEGVELGLTITPVKKDNFIWDLRYTFSTNKSKLVELNDQLEHVDIAGLLGIYETWFRAYPGGNIGVFEVSKPKIYIDEAGEEHVVVNSQGYPEFEDEGYKEYGKFEHDYIMGLTSDMTIYKHFTVSFNLDFRKGGLMYSRTLGMTYFTGTTPVTLYNDRQPFIIENSVMVTGTDDNGTPDDVSDDTYIYEENTRPVLYEVLGGSDPSFWANGGFYPGEHEIIDKTFVKLRSLNVRFNIPSKWISKYPINSVSVGFVGNNLLLWTPKGNNFIDPELTTFGTGIRAEFGEFGATPSIRSLGFNLSFKF
ncbi:MAG: SusC/RagA family TonB-linked outer membrane protein [Bacteroidales bacterium]|nr:SusC/RagA family TonB-linked outer membrane protein [Bacteroidales bacterium]